MDTLAERLIASQNGFADPRNFFLVVIRNDPGRIRLFDRLWVFARWDSASCEDCAMQHRENVRTRRSALQARRRSVLFVREFEAVL